MTDSPADKLTAAAQKLRKAATLHGDPGPWIVHQANGFLRVGPTIDPDTKGWRPKTGANLPEERRDTAEYIALLHPGVGLAVADWLDGAAKSYNASVVAAERVWGPGASAVRDEWVTERIDQNALAVARALLGEVTE